MITAATLMQLHPKSVESSMSITQLERLMMSSGHSGFPVVDDGRLVGVVSRSDVVRSIMAEQSRAEQVSDYYLANLPEGPEGERTSFEATAAQVGVRLAGLTVDDVMSHSVVSIEAGEPVQRVAAFMTEGGLHRLPVVEDGKLVGLLSSSDLVQAIADGRLVESNDPSTAQRPLPDSASNELHP